ncbi:hypothetical protein Mgra_00006024 [Meloidogyne graminicola]|uniref:Uncharacterized protein n=1 Tax=Meloidogyne graminicola TaxID=189291 RepID=A0A8S9ZNB7_9BILA|nr:hypothetical protein Mgra_00006024 [Meloidogyne graminicola]
MSGICSKISLIVSKQFVKGMRCFKSGKSANNSGNATRGQNVRSQQNDNRSSSSSSLSSSSLDSRINLPQVREQRRDRDLLVPAAGQLGILQPHRTDTHIPRQNAHHQSSPQNARRGVDNRMNSPNQPLSEIGRRDTLLLSTERTNGVTQPNSSIQPPRGAIALSSARGPYLREPEHQYPPEDNSIIGSNSLGSSPRLSSYSDVRGSSAHQNNE